MVGMMRELPFKYRLLRSKRRRRTTSISVDQQGVVVRAPYFVSLLAIENFLLSKQEWVLGQLERVMRVLPKAKSYHDGEKHLYFGEEFSLKLVPSTLVKKPRLSLLYDRFEAMIPYSWSPADRENGLKKVFTDWYLERGKKVIAQKTDYFCRKLGVSYNRIVLKKVSSIWGSCSRRNNLNFNRKLIMAPHRVVDYVIIHEVSHLLHRHHQKSFWEVVKRLDPDYKNQIKWLKEHFHLLTF